MVESVSKTGILMFGHGGYGNRGCEAIVRSTAKMIADSFEYREIKLASHDFEKDSQSNPAQIDMHIPHNTAIDRYTWPWLKYVFYNRVLKDYEASFEISQREVIDAAASSDICLSVGGDNYCYGEPLHLYALDRAIKRMGKRLVLWGASIEPGSVSERMKEDLGQFDALFARESVTYHELKRLNISKNIFLYPDPAFCMEKEDMPLPAGWKSGKMVGVNLSPLIMNYESRKGMAFASVSKLIDEIIHLTDFNIALIPHVVTEKSSDYAVLKMLYDRYRDSGRLVLVGDGYTAPQLKGLISKCRIFVGARTHSTIAAYSSCVPALVLGYSVKSRGIARDIFGGEQNYVLPVQEMRKPEQLCKAFRYFLKNEHNIRKHLEKVMPAYIKNAGEAAVMLKQVAAGRGRL